MLCNPTRTPQRDLERVLSQSKKLSLPSFTNTLSNVDSSPYAAIQLRITISAGVLDQHKKYGSIAPSIETGS